MHLHGGLPWIIQNTPLAVVCCSNLNTIGKVPLQEDLDSCLIE